MFGLLLFTLIIVPVVNIIKKNSIHFHFYADDMQLYLSMKPDKTNQLSYLQTYLKDIKKWTCLSIFILYIFLFAFYCETLTKLKSLCWALNTSEIQHPNVTELKLHLIIYYTHDIFWFVNFILFKYVYFPFTCEGMLLQSALFCSS